MQHRVAGELDEILGRVPYISEAWSLGEYL